MFVEELWSQSSKWYQTWDNQLLYSRENGVRWAVILYKKSMGGVLVVWIQKLETLDSEGTLPPQTPFFSLFNGQVFIIVVAKASEQER